MDDWQAETMAEAVNAHVRQLRGVSVSAEVARRVPEAYVTSHMLVAPEPPRTLNRQDSYAVRRQAQESLYKLQMKNVVQELDMLITARLVGKRLNYILELKNEMTQAIINGADDLDVEIYRDALRLFMEATRRMV